MLRFDWIGVSLFWNKSNWFLLIRAPYFLPPTTHEIIQYLYNQGAKGSYPDKMTDEQLRGT